MPSDLELMDIHAKALFLHDQKGRMECVNAPGRRRPAPKLFLGVTKERYLCRFRYDIPDGLAEEAEDLVLSEPIPADLWEKPACLERMRALPETQTEVRKIAPGPAYMIPKDIRQPGDHVVRIHTENANLLQFGFSDSLDDLEQSQPFLALIEGGKAVSICCNARLSPEAAEAGVQTLEAYRGRGYAGEVTAAWGRAIRELGRVPLYSTASDNLDSQSVARKLGLILYGVDYSFS